MPVTNVHRSVVGPLIEIYLWNLVIPLVDIFARKHSKVRPSTIFFLAVKYIWILLCIESLLINCTNKALPMVFELNSFE